MYSNRLKYSLVTSLVGFGVLLLAKSLFGKNKRTYDKPSREYTIDEALDEIRKYEASGDINVINYGDGKRITVGGKIAGIQHTYLSPSGYVQRSQIYNLDPRFALYLIRLDLLLGDLGINELIDAGITHGGSNPDDVHNQGRAIDISELKGPYVDLSVLRDWGQKPSGDIGSYRLSKSDPGYEIFKSIYEFATEEGADRSAENPYNEGSPTSIGERSYVLTPDTPNTSLRSAHQNHMHIQLGRTIGVEP